MVDQQQEAVSEGPIVGIDLGTTNSVVAMVIDGKPQVLAEDGESIMPSVVGLDPQGKLISGQVAKNQWAAFPDRTVVSIKRKMGTMDPVPLGDQTYTPPEISAMILRRLRERASRALSTDVCRAVITVPAFFNEAQRQATREAGQLAGWQVERIINEPTAATLVYHAGDVQRRHVVVYDFGGGTFDVSVVRMEDGVTEVLSSKGDTHLGGDDLDLAMLDHVAEEFIRRHQLDPRQDPSARFRLLQACERAKCELSLRAEATIQEPFVAQRDGQPLSFSMPIRRYEFEELIRPFIDRTIACLDTALHEVGLTVDQIDDLVLVGGSTRIPLVANRLREEFVREPSRAVDPDLAVAMGAAIQAAMHQGQAAGPVLVDVSTHTLGVAVLEDFGWRGSQLKYVPLLHRNTPLPTMIEDNFNTVHEKQKQIHVQVYQGEHEELELNTEIGEMYCDIAPGERNSRIVIRFELTLDGTLKVTAIQPTTGRRRELRINNALSHFQDEQKEKAESRLAELFGASDELQPSDALETEPRLLQPSGPLAGMTLETDLASSDVEQWESAVQAFPQVPALLAQCEQLGVKLSPEDREEVGELRGRLRQAVIAGDSGLVESLAGELDDILFYAR